MKQHNKKYTKHYRSLAQPSSAENSLTSFGTSANQLILPENPLSHFWCRDQDLMALIWNQDTRL